MARGLFNITGVTSRARKLINNEGLKSGRNRILETEKILNLLYEENTNLMSSSSSSS